MKTTAFKTSFEREVWESKIEHMTILSGNLIKYRAKKKWTQARLAREAGVSLRTISMIESVDPKINPRLNTLSKITDAVGLKLQVAFER